MQNQEKKLIFMDLFLAWCELTVINTFLKQAEEIEPGKNTFEYEPTPTTKGTNPEFKIEFKGNTYYVEVKTPNLEFFYKKKEKIVTEKEPAVQYDARIFNLTPEQKEQNLTSLDSRIKDFLESAEEKFFSTYFQWTFFEFPWFLATLVLCFMQPPSPAWFS